MISKEKFVEIIEYMRKISDFTDKVNIGAIELCDELNLDFEFSLYITEEEIVIELLKEIFKDTDYIDWWIYDTNYGREEDYNTVYSTDNKGKMKEEVLDTAEKLYDFLMENKREYEGLV